MTKQFRFRNGPAAGQPLMEHQKEGVSFLKAHQRCILGDEQGLGKTIQVLVWLHEEKLFPALILCPAGLRTTWRDEIHNAFGNRYKVVVVDNERSIQRIMAIRAKQPCIHYNTVMQDPLQPVSLLDDADIYIVAYEHVWYPNLLKELGKMQFRAACADEAHRLKEPTAKRTRAALRLLAGSQEEPGRVIQALVRQMLKKKRMTPKEVAAKLDDFFGVPVDRRDLFKVLTTTFQPPPLVVQYGHGIERVVLATGTPLVNRPRELWTLVSTVGRGQGIREFEHRWSFLSSFCDPQTKKVGDRVIQTFNGLTNADRLHDLLNRIMIRRLKTDELPDLPAKIFTTVRLDYDEDLYNRVAAGLRRDADVEDWHAALRAIAGYGGRETVSHLVIVALNKLLETAAMAKLPTAIEWIREHLEAGGKLVIFANRHLTIRKLEAALADHLGSDAVTTYFGEDPQSVRDDRKERFQTDPSLRVLITGIQAGGVGLTLTAASDVAMVEYPMTPGEYHQAVDRVHRIGQQNGVNVYNLAAENTVEEWLIDLLQGKSTTLDRVLDAGRPVNRIRILPSIIEALEMAPEPRWRPRRLPALPGGRRRARPLTAALAADIVRHLQAGMSQKAIRQEIGIGGSLLESVYNAWRDAGQPTDPTAVIADLLEKRQQGKARETAGKALPDRDAKIAEARRLRQEGMSQARIAAQLGVSTGWIRAVTKQEAG